MKTFELADYLTEKRALVDRALDRAVPPEDTFPPLLHRAIRYSLSAPGKRLRPLLCLAACAAVGGRDEDALPAGCALEMIHTHSLIHDDLPCMDDDDLRRGIPTCHKAFGEATAVLAGDALLNLAFETLSGSQLSDAKVRAMFSLIGQAAGSRGMCGGQQADLEAEGKPTDLETLERIHRLKTGALLTAAVACGGVAGGADPEQAEALERYGRAAGLAFQVSDDILDVVGDPETLGKTPGKDAAQEKTTYPSVVGLEESRSILRRLAGEAVAALNGFGPEAAALRALAEYIAERDR